ncbi:endonuclease/exonuclease/phosphatase family protein [Galbibacter sp. EGI 63066]|uniref:endonuclease/exonuclease/phosphatase family protein n=1 Tax=Galbibacter sp. EGI 63066 TaxID=2993559 RepID=UPI0022494473|nr:endonuclease/exonuclease/phosphatase family protein [Galbibacter sp. EGI 63066]MCX2680545.1 endonuclease/exonuclease/phosphatase family protein [Galbibacter sp. EGI 63066]
MSIKTSIISISYLVVLFFLTEVKINLIVFLLLLLSYFYGYPQEKQYSVTTVAFYNLENLYDTENDSLIRDDDRTPDGRYQWTEKRYRSKLTNMAKVINQLGYKAIDTVPENNFPDIIGLAEIENRKVLNDLISHPLLLPANYGIVHKDSPDERGIDVALLYRKDSFIPNNIDSRRLIIHNDEAYRDYTRDQLVVDGYLNNERFCFIVNHWPSRSGGERRSRPYREAAARLNKKIIDSLQWKHPDIKIISMGDFNDNPTNNSFKKILRTQGSRKHLEEGDLYNPMEKIYKKGIGSLAYRDEWSLFDQIYFTENLLKNNSSYRFWKAGIYDVDFLKTKNGKYKGYPLRTFAAGVYTNGYADHFPVYVYLVKERCD